MKTTQVVTRLVIYVLLAMLSAALAPLTELAGSDDITWNPAQWAVFAVGILIAGLTAARAFIDGSASMAKAGKENGTGRPPGGSTMVLLLLLLPICLLVVACGSFQPNTRFTQDGCILVGQQLENTSQEVWVGTCNDGRLLVEWEAEQPNSEPVTVRATRYKGGNTVIRYLTANGWVEWSSKSGVMIGPVPDVENIEPTD